MKLITFLTITLFFVIFSVPVLAENTATSSTKTQDLKDVRADKVEKIRVEKGEVKESLDTKIERLEPNKRQIVKRVRNNVIKRYGVLERLIEKSGNLLTKLQERIDKAQKAGLSTKVADGYMSDAKEKLADAQANLDSIKSLKDNAIDKKTFQDLQKKFIVIHKDLNAVRLDGARVIAELKKFNAEKPKPTKTATTSAITKP